MSTAELDRWGSHDCYGGIVIESFVRIRRKSSCLSRNSNAVSVSAAMEDVEGMLSPRI